VKGKARARRRRRREEDKRILYYHAASVVLRVLSMFFQQRTTVSNMCVPLPRRTRYAPDQMRRTFAIPLFLSEIFFSRLFFAHKFRSVSSVLLIAASVGIVWFLWQRASGQSQLLVENVVLGQRNLVLQRLESLTSVPIRQTNLMQSMLSNERGYLSCYDQDSLQRFLLAVMKAYQSGVCRSFGAFLHIIVREPLSIGPMVGPWSFDKEKAGMNCLSRRHPRIQQ